MPRRVLVPRSLAACAFVCKVAELHKTQESMHYDIQRHGRLPVKIGLLCPRLLIEGRDICTGVSSDLRQEEPAAYS